MSIGTVRPGTIALFSDLACPWASLAVHRLLRRRTDLGLDGSVVLDHRCFPLELINGRLTPKTLLDAETAVIGSHEPALGWHPWRRRGEEYPNTTLLPLAAVQAAKAEAVGGLAASEQLDAALRDAWFAGSRSIQLHAEILAVARSCSLVDADALAAALGRGAGSAEVFASWREAVAGGVQGSPQLFLADGFSVHNPGITLAWTGGPARGLPVIKDDDPGVYDEVLDRATHLR